MAIHHPLWYLLHLLYVVPRTNARGFRLRQAGKQTEFTKTVKAVRPLKQKACAGEITPHGTGFSKIKNVLSKQGYGDIVYICAGGAGEDQSVHSL